MFGEHLKCFTLIMKYTLLTKRTDPDKVLRDKAFNIAKNPQYDG